MLEEATNYPGIQPKSKPEKKSVEVALVGVACVVDAKAMWGARRKKDDDADVVDNFVYRKGAPKAAAAKPKIVDQITTKRMAKRNTEDWATSLKPMLDSILENFDQIIESPLLDEYINLDTMRQVFEAMPQLKDVPEVKAFFESEEAVDQESLKEKLSEAFGLFKTYLLELQELFENPAKLNELINTLPPEALTLLNALKSGDMSPLKAMLNEVPGLEPSQKSLLSDLMDGKTDSLMKAMQETVQNPDHIEQLRQQLLENPESLAALGISEDVLQDPAQWAALMGDGLQEMMRAMMQAQADDGAEEVEVTAASQAKARRARQRFAA